MANRKNLRRAGAAATTVSVLTVGLLVSGVPSASADTPPPSSSGGLLGGLAGGSGALGGLLPGNSANGSGGNPVDSLSTNPASAISGILPSGILGG
jgi:hypothetical protein